MKIKEINDIKKLNIICCNKEETKECFSILEKLGLDIYKNNEHKDYLFIVRYTKSTMEKNEFASSFSTEEAYKNINFYNFKQETKKFLKRTVKENLTVDEKELIKYIKNNKVAINCPTKEDYNRLTEILDRNGETWDIREKFSNFDCWFMYAKRTCISFFKFERFQYSRIEFYIEEHFKILSVQELFEMFTIKKEEKYLTTHAELLANVGKKVSCYILGAFIEEGRIQEENGDIYICQNVIPGISCDNKLGYKHAWFISIIHKNITKIKLLEEPKVEDIEYDKNSGRIWKINNYKSLQKIYIVSDGFFRDAIPINAYSRDYIDFIVYMGLGYISKETCEKAEKKMIIKIGLEKLALSLNCKYGNDISDDDLKLLFDN